MTAITIDEYIAGFPEKKQDVLQQIRQCIREAAPDAMEKISYQMSGFWQGEMLIWFSGMKSHIGIYPANSGVITATFPATGAAPPTVINIAAVPGVTPPAAGATPVTTITETAQYTGTVTWSPTVSGTFAYSTTYTATITLTAKAGYTLTGVGANFFTVASATTVSNSANSGVITAVFPATAAAPITIAAVPGVTPPVAGATPVTTITETA